MELKSMVQSLSPRSRFGLWAGVAGILLLTGLALWWVFGSRQQVLAAHLKEPEAAEIVEALNGWKVPYTIVDDGAAITVPSDQVYDVRMRLVSAGVPKGGHVGFEIFNDADFGVTEFAQRVNYQRALQGELERTIASLPGVDTARVHLTIRRPGLFVGETETSKASVAVTLTPGQTLSRGQINGIRSLVAAAVEGLSTDQVSVLDSSGALLASASAGGANVDARADEESALEQRIQARLGSLLREALGENRHFFVAVDVALNFDTVREVSERPVALVGDQSVVLRRRVTGTADADGVVSPREESEYVHGTTRQEVSRAPGRVERLSVAVMLPPDLSVDEVERLKSLVAASAGIDEARGDRLEVGAMGADAIATEPRPEVVGATVTPPPAPRGPTGFEWKILLVGTLGLLIGAVAVTATTRRPRQLTASEREAVVLKLRGWLADGRLPQ
jgi:flagellar M-ring protein FliF